MWKTGQPLLCWGGGSEDSSSVSPARCCRTVGANSLKALARYLSIQNFDGVRSRARSASLLLLPPTAICDARSEFITAAAALKTALTYLFRYR
jgi:hypothetical protein